MKKSILTLTCLFFLTAMFSGCASLQSVSMTQVPENRSNEISAYSSSWSFLGIYFTNDFVDEAINELKNKCPGGNITGVYTKYETYLYVLITNRAVTAKAFCKDKKRKG